jgi:hypothetical protein
MSAWPESELEMGGCATSSPAADWRMWRAAWWLQGHMSTAGFDECRSRFGMSAYQGIKWALPLSPRW